MLDPGIVVLELDGVRVVLARAAMTDLAPFAGGEEVDDGVRHAHTRRVAAQQLAANDLAIEALRALQVRAHERPVLELLDRRRFRLYCHVSLLTGVSSPPS